MKKWMMILGVMLTSVASMAQQREGTFTVQPKVGMNLSSMTDADKSIVDLCFGMEAEYMLTDMFSLSAGLVVSNQGAKYDEDTIDLDYANVPIMANVYVLPGLALKAGVQPGFRTKGKAKTDDGSFDLDEFYKFYNMVLDDDVNVRKMDFSIPVGISYEYRNIVLDARYNWGLIKIANVGDASYNRVFQLTLGYKFALDF